MGLLEVQQDQAGHPQGQEGQEGLGVQEGLPQHLQDQSGQLVQGGQGGQA
jgi:hypothetical protein